ncbi:MAG TPA: hypothetical protein V6D22_22455 [Candidatus Obscuribacterales bacterium]
MKRFKDWTNVPLLLLQITLMAAFFSVAVLADTPLSATDDHNSDKEIWNLDAAKAAVAGEPQNGFLWNKLGMVYSWHQEFQNARRAFERAYVAGYSLGLANLAIMDEQFGHGETALAELQRYVQLTGSGDKKIAQIIVTLKRNPTDVRHFPNILPCVDTTSDAARKSRHESLKKYVAELRAAPMKDLPSEPNQQGLTEWRIPGGDPSDEHIRAAQAALKLGNKADARRELERVLSFDPNNKTAYKELFALLDDENEVNEAFELVNRQLAQFPADADYLYNLSYILARRNDKVGARKAYSEASKLKPPDGDATN